MLITKKRKTTGKKEQQDEITLKEALEEKDMKPIHKK